MTRSLIGLPLSLGRRGAGLALSATLGVAERGWSVAAHLANALLGRDQPDLDFDGVEHRPDSEPAKPSRRAAAEAPPAAQAGPAAEAPPAASAQPAAEAPPAASAQPAAEAPPAASAQPTPEASPAAPAPEPREPAAAPAEPALEEELSPRHVSEEATLVEEVAEAGAEDGAGAQVHVAEPWEGYRQMTAGDVVDRITGADAAVLAAVELYELSARGRQTVLEAVRRELVRADRDQ